MAGRILTPWPKAIHTAGNILAPQAAYIKLVISAQADSKQQALINSLFSWSN